MHNHALVVGKFAPLHRGHQRLLDTASTIASDVTAIVWSNPDFADMPNDVRANWIRTLYPSVRVLVADDGPANVEPDYVHREYVRQLLARHALTPDVVVTAEAYGPGFADHLGIKHIALDREATPTWSGTNVRATIHDNRLLLDPRIYAHFVERVVLLGAESTGKSTLTRRMAEAFDTVFVDEYGREHYEAKGGDLDLEDYVTIAEVHRQREDKAILRANRYLFVDTNAVTTMFFSHYYNRNSLPALACLADDCSTRYQHVFVCDDDIPFEQDGWRDNEVWRGRMHGMVLHDLTVRRIPYTLITGSIDDRIAQVVAALNQTTPTPTPPSPRSAKSLGPRPS
jgi:HTH-type transcriptional regulator, transcriptional repressor of NAD biosynthesis genes